MLDPTLQQQPIHTSDQVKQLQQELKRVKMEHEYTRIERDNLKQTLAHTNKLLLHQ